MLFYLGFDEVIDLSEEKLSDGVFGGSQEVMVPTS
jgi:hypothetical protein